MTKKDFELIARVLKYTRNVEPESHRLYVEAFASVLANTNPRFDHAKFVRACQP